MEYQDKTLTCKECGKEFTFTASEQEFYAGKGFQNEPSRCPDDRAKFRQEKRNRPKTEVTCAKCGKLTTVPFEPKGDRPVYCLDCFKEMKDQPATETAAPVAEKEAETAEEPAAEKEAETVEESTEEIA